MSYCQKQGIFLYFENVLENLPWLTDILGGLQLTDKNYAV